MLLRKNGTVPGSVGQTHADTSHVSCTELIRMEVASSRMNYLPILSAAKTSKLSLLVKHHIMAIDEAK